MVSSQLRELFEGASPQYTHRVIQCPKCRGLFPTLLWWKCPGCNGSGEIMVADRIFLGNEEIIDRWADFTRFLEEPCYDHPGGISLSMEDCEAIRLMLRQGEYQRAELSQALTVEREKVTRLQITRG